MGAQRASINGLQFNFFKYLSRKYGREPKDLLLALIEYAISIGLCACGERYQMDWETDICYCPICGEMLWIDEFLEKEEMMEEFARKHASYEWRIAYQHEVLSQKLKHPKAKRQSLEKIRQSYGKYGEEIALFVGMMRYLESIRRNWERDLAWKERQDGFILAQYIYPRRRRLAVRQFRIQLRRHQLSWLIPLVEEMSEDMLVEWLFTGSPSMELLFLSLINRWWKRKRRSNDEGGGDGESRIS